MLQERTRENYTGGDLTDVIHHTGWLIRRTKTYFGFFLRISPLLLCKTLMSFLMVAGSLTVW